MTKYRQTRLELIAELENSNKNYREELQTRNKKLDFIDARMKVLVEEVDDRDDKIRKLKRELFNREVTLAHTEGYMDRVRENEKPKERRTLLKRRETDRNYSTDLYEDTMGDYGLHQKTKKDLAWFEL